MSLDPSETAEWCESLDALVAAHGPARARFLLDALVAHARRRGVNWQPALITPYVKPLTEAVARYIEECGVEVSDAVSLEVDDNVAVGRLDPQRATELKERWNESHGEPGKRGADLIYIDDRPENIETGKVRGWRTVLHETPQKTRQALVAMGVI